jgi:hypothetical protein
MVASSGTLLSDVVHHDDNHGSAHPPPAPCIFVHTEIKNCGYIKPYSMVSKSGYR